MFTLDRFFAFYVNCIIRILPYALNTSLVYHKFIVTLREFNGRAISRTRLRYEDRDERRESLIRLDRNQGDMDNDEYIIDDEIEDNEEDEEEEEGRGGGGGGEERGKGDFFVCLVS